MKRNPFALGAFAAMLVAGGTLVHADDAPTDADAVFQRLDKNGDGKISASEIPEDQSRHFERLLRAVGKKSDGELTREEFRQANRPEQRPDAAAGRNGEPNADIQQRFDMLDANKDGKVTLDEVPEPLKDRLRGLFERSGKQELTVKDFARFADGNRPEPGELFKRLDANSDGKLTKAELPPEASQRLAPVFEKLGKDELTLDDFIRNLPAPPNRADGPRKPADQPGEPGRRPEARGDTPQPEGRPGERRADANADRPRDGERRPEFRGPAIFRLLDTNQDGHLSKEELAKAGDLFEQLDRNHDGQLDPAELMGGPGPGAGRDAPRDGAVRDGNPREAAPRGDAPAPRDSRKPADNPGQDRTEGRDAPARDKGQRGDAAPARGEGPQTRDSGRPAADEGRSDRASRKADGAGEPAPLFKRLDRDGDGKISKEEAPDRLKERFAMLDTNGDGSISLDEFRSGMRDLGDPARGRQPEGRPESTKRD